MLKYGAYGGKNKKYILVTILILASGWLHKEILEGRESTCISIIRGFFSPKKNPYL